MTFIRKWEKDIHLDFDPTAQTFRLLSFVNYFGSSVENHSSQHHCSAESAIPNFMNQNVPELENLHFQNPEQFVSGQIHEQLDQWNSIMDDSDSNVEVKGWLEHGVSVHNYIKPFKGSFWGSEYDSEFPPPRVFSNSNKCQEFAVFVSATVLERLQNGSIDCVGRVGVDPPPYIVAPLTVEPSKPRLCINLMYLNNWIMDKPFSLDTLKDVPRVVNDSASLL